MLLDFYIVKTPSPYNIILGQDWLTPYKVICSTYHMLVKFLIEHGVAEVQGEKKTFYDCVRPALKPKPTPRSGTSARTE